MTERSVDPRVAGVDGCPGGWIAVLAGGDLPPVARRVDRVADLLTGPDGPQTVAIDMPIGLPERVGLGGRGPERAARAHLGERQSSVFSIPSRAAVWAGAGLPDTEGYRETNRIALLTSDPPRKVSKQGFYLFPKIRELDELLVTQPALRERVFECHPELAFWRLNGERAMSLPKKIKGRVNPDGMAERRACLATAAPWTAAILANRPPKGVGEDDLLDATACAVIAARRADGLVRPFPDPPLIDARGIVVAIWA
jgi:predicted RNase H-like nuclease